MEINLDLDLVGAEFDESSVTVDDDMSIRGVLHLKGTVDAEWLAAFGESAPLEVPWRLDDGNVLLFGPLPLREVAGYLGTLRSQINKANDSVQGERHRRAMAEYLDAEERARAYRQAMEALSGLFHRRLSTLEVSSG